MSRNVGSTDRVLRIVLGLVVIGVGVVQQSGWGALGLLLLGTGAVGWCPAYLPLRLSTRRNRRAAS